MEIGDNMYKVLFEQSPDAIVVIDPDTMLPVMFNDRMVEMLGYTMEEFASLKISDYEAQESAAEVRSHIRKAVDQGADEFETLFRTKSGELRNIQAIVRSVTVGGEVFLHNVLRDITDLKRAEEEVLKEKTFTENALNNLKDAFFVIDLEGRFLRWNETICTVTGYSNEEIAAMKATDFFPDEENPLVLNTIARVIKEGSGCLVGTAVTKDGRRIPFEYTGTILKDRTGNVVGISGIGRDVTERKQAIEALRASEARYNALVLNIPLGVFAMRASPEGPTCFEYVSPRLCDMLGVDRDEILRDVNMGFAMAHPDDRERLLRETMDAIRSLTPFRWVGRFLINGESRWVSIKSDPTLLPDGDSIWNGVVSDITERKQAEDALRESEARYRQLHESMMDAFVKMDMTGRIVEFNTAYREMLGYTAEELLHLNYTDFTPARWHAMEAHIVEEQLMSRGFSEVYEKEYVRKDGTVFPVELRTFVIRDEGRVPYAMWGIVRDITERKQMEEHLHTDQKLESVGVLAGGIAHDFNNILTVIMGYISLVKMTECEGSDNFKSLTMAEEACRHATDLSYRLLTFTKGGTPVRTMIDMREMLADTVRFALSGSNLQVEYTYRDDIPPLNLDEGQMRQVFSNLTFNARDAMPDGGLLSVTVEQTAITCKDALPVPPGRYAKIVFRDQGAGIPREIIGRIFDPYFTTKELGSRKGQGLGLTICYSIIARHGGAMTAESEPGKGAAFTIFLPMAEPVVGKMPAARAVARVKPAASRAILVMDDEEWIRNLLGDILGLMGHEAMTVPDSASAIEAYRAAQAAGRPFDLVILDLTIQGGPGGLATMKELLALDPAARGVISSGYADDPAVLNYRKCGFVAAMAKPYSVATLQKIIAELFPG